MKQTIIFVAFKLIHEKYLVHIVYKRLENLKIEREWKRTVNSAACDQALL